jgi:ribosome recycling factor
VPQYPSAVLRFHLPLVEPDMRISRIRLPDKSCVRTREAAFSARKPDLAEETRVAIRNIRRDANKNIDAEEKAKTITEDERDQLKEQVQELTKTYEGKVNDAADKKTAEVME